MSDEEEIPGSEEEEGGEEQVAISTAQEAPAAVAADAPNTEKPSNELKVVIILKANKAMLGVQSPDCDPVYKTMEGDLAAVLKVVPILVADARLKWSAAPRYPKADLPKPTAPATTTPPATSKPAAKAAPAQPKFF
ncbi:MAG: hypothetical protein HYX80_10380 [Chloroflexi bacterium]|nr:hypothetical protein [Chloroflexota bacterium]